MASLPPQLYFPHKVAPIQEVVSPSSVFAPLPRWLWWAGPGFGAWDTVRTVSTSMAELTWRWRAMSSGSSGFRWLCKGARLHSPFPIPILHSTAHLLSHSPSALRYKSPARLAAVAAPGLPPPASRRRLGRRRTSESAREVGGLPCSAGWPRTSLGLAGRS